MKKERLVSEVQIKRLCEMLEAVKGMDLSEKETKFLKWLSGWEYDSVYAFISIIKKARSDM